MNKYLFIFGLAGTALFSACSTSDDFAADIPSQGLTEEEKAMIVEAGQDSDVPITLGSVGSRKSGMTRAAIDSDDGTNLFETPYDGEHPNPADGKSQYLGVFCLAKGKQVGAPSLIGSNPMWSEAYKTSYPHANWLNNVPAKVSKHAASAASPIDGGEDEDYSYIQFMKDDYSATKVCYYPFGNWYYYDFFAYYPRQASVTTNAESCIVDIDIDGTQDIIWGAAIGEDNLHQRLYALADPDDPNSTKVYAYSSKYLRLMKELDEDDNGTPDNKEYDVVPGFEFKHKLTQFVFSVKPHVDPSDLANTNAKKLHDKGFKITGMKLENVYNQLKLIVASKDATAGDLSIRNTSSTTGVADITVKNPTDDSELTAFYIAGDPEGAVSTAETSVGYAIVPASELIADRYYNEYIVSIQMTQSSGGPVPDTKITLPLPDNGDDPAGFLAGHKYKIVLDIYNPTEIQATATLADWDETDSGTATDHTQTIAVD